MTLAEHGMSGEVLRRLAADGLLERRARGVYVPPEWKGVSTTCSPWLRASRCDLPAHRGALDRADVAIDALQEYLRSPGRSMDDLWTYAGTCRVQNVMRPYLEAIVEAS